MNLKVEYLGEIKVIFEMALGNESENQVGSIHEKNQRSKISWDYPFKMILKERRYIVLESCDNSQRQEGDRWVQAWGFIILFSATFYKDNMSLFLPKIMIVFLAVYPPIFETSVRHNYRI